MTKPPKCRRAVCQRPNDGCKHTQTGDLYCRPCAAKINRANPEVPNLITIPHEPDHWSRRITRCETLVDGWDSYDAKPPTPEVITAARQLLAVVLAKKAPIDRLNPSVVGGIGFTFRLTAEAHHVYVEFRNTGTCHALYHDPKGDQTEAPVHKIETTQAGYEKLVDDLTAWLDSKEPE
jgi:hypothetical protein